MQEQVAWSAEETFVATTAQAMYLRLGGGQRLPWSRWRPAAPRRPDFEGLARSYVERYPRRRHHGLVLSDLHGSAAHLAAALDVPWLPLPPEGEPLPGAYQELLNLGCVAGAPVLVITTTPGSHRLPPGVVGITAEARRAGLAPTVVHMPGSALSANVAETYRRWLRGAGKRGNRLVVECGALLDAWHVVRAGLVPYWCPDASMRHADTLTWWLAGEHRYNSVEIMLQAPGGPTGAFASAGILNGWTFAARFAERDGTVEPACRQAFPDQPLNSRHATRVLRAYPHDLPLPQPIEIAQAVRTVTAG